MGVCGAGGDKRPVPLRRNDFTGSGELRGSRLVSTKDRCRGLVPRECIRIARCARQCLGVGRGLLACRLHGCAVRRERVDDGRRLQRPRSAWRLLEQRTEDSPLRVPLQVRIRASERRLRLSRCPDTCVAMNDACSIRSRCVSCGGALGVVSARHATGGIARRRLPTTPAVPARRDRRNRAASGSATADRRRASRRR